MPHPLYCIYNQTNECFLSLGATLGDRPFMRFKQWLGIGPRRIDEGCWIRPFRSSAIRLFAARDLVYLDPQHRVVHVLESVPAFRRIPHHADAASLLALPARTIASSQTRPGNQLLICAPKEMEWRLRTLPSPEHTPAAASDPVGQWLGELNPAPIIRDLSTRGLYLVTRDRWPVGAEVKLSLQPIGRSDAHTLGPVTVRMKVTQWGSDGVGLEFTGHPAKAAELTAMYVN